MAGGYKYQWNKNMAQYTFTTIGDYIEIEGVSNRHDRLHNSSQCITWRYDDSGDFYFLIDGEPYRTEDVTLIEFDGVALTVAADFKTQIELMFTGLAGGGSSYLVYTALISGTGSGDPSVTILGTNTIGNIVWVDNGGGGDGTLANSFPYAKTWVSVTNDFYTSVGYTAVAEKNPGVDDAVYFEVFDLSGSAVAPWRVFIEIRVYP